MNNSVRDYVVVLKEAQKIYYELEEDDGQCGDMEASDHWGSCADKLSVIIKFLESLKLDADFYILKIHTTYPSNHSVFTGSMSKEDRIFSDNSVDMVISRKIREMNKIKEYIDKIGLLKLGGLGD